MPRYTSDHHIKSGVPLGGIGAGKIEILPNGCITHFTHQNNWSRPMNAPDRLNGSDIKVGHHFAIRVRSGGRTVAKLLQTTEAAGLPTIDGIEYHGSYPLAYLDYKDPGIPAKVRLEAVSPIIPGDSKGSTMPAAVFLFQLENGEQESEVSIMATARNTVGEWNVGRYNELLNETDLQGVVFRVDSPLPYDTSSGSVCLAAAGGPEELSHALAWNLKTQDPFLLTLENEDMAVWPGFLETGRLSTSCAESRSEIVRGEGVELAGAVAVTVRLKPQEARTIPFVLAWHMPVHHSGHIYENDYEDAAEVARRALRASGRIHQAAMGWSNKLEGSGIPDWLFDALVNNLYVLSSGTWWDRHDRFAFFEASRMCQLMNTVDVLYYASVPVSWCYPDLSKRAMALIAAAQRPDGYIPHDLGRGRVDYPSDGTTAPPRWKDLCPKYVLMAYRDYIWHGDMAMLHGMYKSVKSAMAWEMSTDTNGDWLPDNEGPDQTFDNWSFRGTNSYTSSIYLASLLACERMSQAVGDSEFAVACRRAYEGGKASFEEQLWNGEFYTASAGSGAHSGPGCDTCTVGQLNGQWYAHLLGLGHILSPDRVSSAVRAMLRLNGGVSPYGAVNSVNRDGSIDCRNLHSANIWPGETYALASLAIYEGFVDQGLELARTMWNTVTVHAMNPWDQPDVVNSEDGSYGFGDHYLRNMVVWALLFALAERDAGVDRALSRLKG